MGEARTAARGKANGKRAEAIEQTARSFRRAGGTMFSHWRKAVHERGASPPQVWILKVLVDREGATPKELAESMGVTPASITGLTRKLERNGFVARERDSKDRRVVRLRPTRKAHLGMAAMRRAALAGATQAFDAWSTRDILALKAMLDRLAAESSTDDHREAAHRRRRRRL
jgi:DNA-binding MarR family transcriptional regulator